MEIGIFYHFRVHTESIDLDTFVEFLKTETDLLFIVKEFGKANKEHIHSTLKLKKAKTTFIDKLKKSFPSICGNKSYSLTPVKDFDKNCRYCYKGAANDYPDILFTRHTEEEWKDYYKRYWNEFKELHKVVNMGCQNGSTLLLPEAKTKTKSKTFMVKICDELWEDHRPIFGSIWYFHGCKDYEPINTLKDNQDYLADYLLRKLGATAKNLDKFIFERLYRGLYNHILTKCQSMNLTQKVAVSMLDCFRHNL